MAIPSASAVPGMKENIFSHLSEFLSFYKFSFILYLMNDKINTE